VSREGGEGEARVSRKKGELASLKKKMDSSSLLSREKKRRGTSYHSRKKGQNPPGSFREKEKDSRYQLVARSKKEEKCSLFLIFVANFKKKKGGIFNSEGMG